MKVIVCLVVVLAVVLFWLPQREGFYNVVPLENIDPEFEYPCAAETIPFLTNPRHGPKLYERVGDSAGVDNGCNHVTAIEVVEWIHRENPKLMYECVLKFDPSAELGNPYHTSRILRLLQQNLPMYANLDETCEKYLPIIRKCFPREMRI